VIKMVVTKQQVIEILNVDEPNYREAAKLGPDALPHLDALVKTADPMLASKATYLASLIQSEQSIDVLRAAAQSDHPEVRVAAAAGARNRVAGAAAGVRDRESNSLNDLLSLLNSDQDAGVRKEAVKSLKSLRATE
jgi:HEAT repeat protein